MAVRNHNGQSIKFEICPKCKSKGVHERHTPWARGFKMRIWKECKYCGYTYNWN